MKKPDSLVEKLLGEEGLSTEGNIDQVIEGIHQIIRKQKAALRQMRWITIGLWLATLVTFVLKFSSSGPLVLRAGDSISLVKIFISIATQFLPAAAVISTILLVVRRHFFSQKEISLRLNLIEAQLMRKNRESDHNA